MREQQHNSKYIDAEYASTFSKLTEITIRELEQAKKLATGIRQLSPLEKAKIEQQATLKAIQSKEAEYQSKTKSAYSLYGQNPFFLMKELSFRRIFDSLQTSPPNIAVAYPAIDTAYRSALELKRLSLQKDILAGQLEQSAKKVEQVAVQTQSGQHNSASAVDEQFRIIHQEKNIHLQLLPDFLLKKISSALSGTNGLTLSQSLKNHKATATKIITTERAAITAYAKANPNIKPPLSKPELEALNTLVALQAKTNLGKRWQDYHVSLLHSESSRHLTKTTNAFTGLIDRALAAERLQEQLRVAAEQKAQAQKQAQALAAAQRAEQERKQQIASALATQEAERLQEQLRVAAEQKAQVQKQAQTLAAAQRAEQERKQQIASALGAHFDELLQQFNRDQPANIDHKLPWMQQKHQELSFAHEEATKAEHASGAPHSFLKSGPRHTLLLRAQKDIDAVFRLRHRIENIQFSTIGGAMATARPLVSTPDGLIAGYEGSRISFQSATDLLEKMRTTIGGGPLAVFGLAVSYSPMIGNGELQRNPVVLSIPLSQLDDNFKLTPGNETDSLPFRVVSSVRGEHSQFYLSPTGENLSDEVRVRYITLDPQTNLYTFTTEGILPRTLTWTPNSAPGSDLLGSSVLPATQPEIRILPGARITQIEGRADEHPICDDADIDDYVLVFPAESGIQPVYVMASRTGPRYEPGTVTGTGQKVGRNWLGNTEQGVGAPVPSEIANLLRGQDFRDFGAFREEFWRSVADDEKLSAQFSRSNLKLMRNGAAPFALPSDHVGERNKFEIHHIQLISEGGAVYDLDNLSIMTPQEHIRLHKGGKKP